MICFPPLEDVPRRMGADVPPGWSACRGFWDVPEEEAIALMERRVPPPERGEGRRVVYRCPKTQRVINSSGYLEVRRCHVCCRRERITTHVQCRFGCEVRFDAMMRQRDQGHATSIDRYTHRYQRAVVVGLTRAGVSCARISGPAILSMSRELVQIGIDVQAATPTGHARISAHDIAVPLSRHAVEGLIREYANEEADRALSIYKELRLVNMKVDAGSVLRSHVTHCLVDSTLDPTLISLVMPAAANNNWKTADYSVFFLTRTQQVQDKGLRICSIVHDNLPAQSNALDRIIAASEERPRTLDIPCFNHLINLVFVHSVRENPDLYALVQELHAWQRLCRALKVNIPKVPKTRWLYILEMIQAIVSVENLEHLMSMNQKIVHDILGHYEDEVPTTFVQLYEVLLPLLTLSKKLEDRATRLPHVIPLISDCIQQWRTLRPTLKNSPMFLGILDSLLTNLIVRFRANAFEEAVTAFILSIEGKELIEARLNDGATWPRHEQDSIEEERAEPVANDEDTQSTVENISDEMVIGDFDEEMKLYDELDLLDAESDNGTREETITKQRRNKIERYKETISWRSLDEKLNHDFLADFLGDADRSLSTYGAKVSKDRGDYYAVALRQWLSLRLDDKLIALRQVQEMNGRFLDFLVWDHVLTLAKANQSWSFFRELAETALYYVSSAVSEADVERALSIQKIIQGGTTTNISPDGVTARLRLYGHRPIDSVKR